jgi:hypothetical protein
MICEKIQIMNQMVDLEKDEKVKIKIKTGSTFQSIASLRILVSHPRIQKSLLQCELPV